MRLVGVALMGLALGCGAASPRPPSKPAEPEPVLDPLDARRPYAATQELPSHAEQPALWLRLENPTKSWAELPGRTQAELIARGPALDALAASMLGQAAAVIDLSQPVDVVIPLPARPGGGYTWSFRVRSPEAVARGDAGLVLRRLRPGAWRIGDDEATREADPGDEEDESEWGDDEAPPPPRCELHHYAAPVGYRVICAGEAEQIAEHAPFLVSAPTLVARRSDVSAQLGGAQYRALVATAVAASRAKVAASNDAEPGTSLGRRLALQLLEALAEHETISLDVSFESGNLRARLDLAFPADPGSAEFEAWLAHADRAALPPSYARLPAAGSVALGFGGLHGKIGQAFFDYLLEQVLLDMDRTSIMPAKSRAEFAAATRAALPEGAQLALAWGRDRAMAQSALADWLTVDDGGAQPSAEQKQQLQEALAGWWVIGVDAPAKQYMPRLERLFTVGMTPLRDRPGASRDRSERRSKLTRVTRKLTGLPPGTLHFISRTRGAHPAQLPYDTHLLLVPDGARVWIVAARSPELSRRKALEQLQRPASSAPAPPPALFALNVTLDALAGAGAWDTPMERSFARGNLEFLDTLPHGGKTHFPLALTILPRGTEGAGWHLRMETELTPQALDDLAAWRGLLSVE